MRCIHPFDNCSRISGWPFRESSTQAMSRDASSKSVSAIFTPDSEFTISPCPHVLRHTTGRPLATASSTTCGVPSTTLVISKTSIVRIISNTSWCGSAPCQKHRLSIARRRAISRYCLSLPVPTKWIVIRGSDVILTARSAKPGNFEYTESRPTHKILRPWALKPFRSKPQESAPASFNIYESRFRYFFNKLWESELAVKTTSALLIAR